MIATVSDRPITVHVEPVLPVKDVVQTVEYWHHVIGFPGKWTWGDPPNHGGVSWAGSTFIQFTLNPDLASRSEGNSVWIKVRNLEKLFEVHQKTGADIVAPITNRPWGVAEYIVRDNNGFYISFASAIAGQSHQAGKLPESVRIVARKITMEEYKILLTSVGWISADNDSVIHPLFDSALFTAIAEDKISDKAIGCAFVFGDGKAFYYVKDVVIHPAWQRKGIGTGLMEELDRWLELNAPDKAVAGLFTGDHLSNFYKQFGFTEACGMYKQINHTKKI
jgi:GNAT superfamily N-acetyltransferase/uncharacterized glyoxalase superfamily protein PhnB